MKSLLSIAAILLLLVSCVETKKAEPEKDGFYPSGILNVAVGIVGDGTSMHSLELINQSGDTLYFDYENNALGGVAVGDVVNVEYPNVEGEMEPTALSIVNVTAMSRRWVGNHEASTYSFTFDESGTMECEGFDEPYTRWSIIGGQLYLLQNDHTDKYEISLLTEDSLILRSLEDDVTLNLYNLK